MSHTAAKASDVQGLLDTGLTAAEITPFLPAAQRFVADHLEGEGVAGSTLTEIEKYLACHFVTLRDPRLRSAKIGDVSETYQRDTQVTEYLKTAAALDPTGQVAQHFLDDDSGKRRAFYRVGTEYGDD